MTLFTELFEGGTAGAAVSGSNTGLVVGTATGAATTTFSTTGAKSGLGMRAVGGVGDFQRCYKDLGADSAQMRFRGYFTLNSLPSSAGDFQYSVDGAGGSFANAMVTGLNASNQLVAKNFAGSTIATYSTALTAATRYRLETFVKPGTGTTDGTLECYLFADDSTTPLFSFVTAAGNAGTQPVRRGSIGKLSSAGSLDITWDACAWDSTGTHADLGPVAGNAAPVVTPGATQNLASTATTTTLTATVTDDTAATTATWALRSGGSSATSNPTVGGTTSTPSLPTASTTITANVTGLLPGQHIFDLTVGDGSLTTVATTIINVTSNAPAYRSITAASYTVVGGGTALQAIQAGTPGSRYLQSTAPPGGAGGSIAYQPLQSAAVPAVFGVVARASDSTTTLAITVTLKQGATVIATRGPFNLTTSDATYGGTTTTGETATITDRGALTTDWTVA